MTHILMYQLPAEQSELATAMVAPQMHAALCAVVEHVRRRLKYADLSAETVAELESVRRVLDDEGALDLVYEL